MKVRITSLVLAVALLGSFAFGATRTSATPKEQNRGGAVGLVAAVVQLFVNDTIDIDDLTAQVGLVNVSKSLNNLRALNNVLNNNKILNNVEVLKDINVEDVSVLSSNNLRLLTDFLNANDIKIGQVVGVDVLSGGDIIVFAR